MTKILIPEEVKSILSKLNNSGYEAYAVGGCARDSLIGKTPKDWDICTSAMPKEVERVFSGEKIIETGLKHGTVTLVRNNILYEITTFRTDGKYTDGRHPDNVQYVTSLREDLLRRDFTINAMAVDKEGNIIDLNGGLDDLKQKKIRCVGNPNDRFKEDSLRILRALRFAARYRFNIDYSTKSAIHQSKVLLKNISQERITSEFRQIISYADKHLLMEFSDVIEIIVPEIKESIGFEQNNPHHIFDVYEHTITAIDNAAQNETIRLALFFHDIGKPKTYIEDENNIGHFPRHPIVGAEMTEDIMRKMRFDNKIVNRVILLVENHDLNIAPSLSFARRLINKFGEEFIFELLEVMKCDKSAQSSNTDKEKTLLNIFILEKYIKQALNEKNCFSLKDLAVNGNDLKEFGIPEGPYLGKILKKLLDFVLENPDKNNKEFLLKKVKLDLM